MTCHCPLGVFALPIGKKLPDILFLELLNKVNSSKKDRISRFLRRQDAQACLFADLLTRSMLIDRSGLSNSEISFSASAFGKPQFNNPLPVHFNVSHSGDWVVCAIDTQEVGIDIEQMTEIDLSISKDFFSDAEFTAIIESDDPGSKFFEYWTLKESYIKYTGKGLSERLDSFRINLRQDGEITVETNGSVVEGVWFRQYEIEDGYKMALCSGRPDTCRTCNILSMEDIIKVMRSAENAL